MNPYHVQWELPNVEVRYTRDNLSDDDDDDDDDNDDDTNYEDDGNEPRMMNIQN